MTNQLIIKLNKDLGTVRGRALLAGMIITVPCDDNLTPIDKFWRNRLEDSPLDNCISIEKEPTKEEKSSKAK